jgi:hypothetical protein
MGANPFADMASPKKNRPRGIWTSTPLSGKIVSVLLILSCATSSNVQRENLGSEQWVLPAIGAVGYTTAFIFAILELLGIADDKGRKFPSILALVFCLLFFGIVGFAIYQGVTKPRGPQAIVNEKHGFQLVSPGPNWDLVAPDKLRRLNPEALAGALSREGKALGMVFVREGETDYEGIGRSTIADFPLVNKREIRFEKLVFLGYPAVRYHIAGNEKSDNKLRHVFDTIFAAEGKLYMLRTLVSDAAGLADESLAEAFLKAFSLTGKPNTEVEKK